MDDNFESQTKLTEFAPLAPEENEQGVSHLISKLFKFGKSYVSSDTNNSAIESATSNDDVSQDSLSTWSTVEINSDNLSTKTDAPSYQYTVDVSEGRNPANVLKRLSNLLALKSSNLQAYKEKELKQFWMPDPVSRECYECCEKFTIVRRKHHCRVCGQIFCSQCCRQKVPGKIVGCAGDLRTCTYCCKVVLSYLQSPDVGAHLTADLRAFQEDLQTKFGNVPNSQSVQQSVQSNTSSKSDSSDMSSLRRRISIGYQEEKFALGRSSNSSYISAEERIKILQNSVSLRNLYEELCGPCSGLILQTHRYRLRSYSNCLLGSEIVDWLIAQHKASTRVQATAICQALLEAGYLKCLTEQGPFSDGYSLYRPQLATCTENNETEEKFDTRNHDEPSWMQQIPHESSTTDSEAEFPSPCAEKTSYRLPSSSSSFLLDLNLEESTVHLIRPSSSDQLLSKNDTECCLDAPAEVNVIQASQHREDVPASGWYNAMDLRSDNGELLAYQLLTDAYKQHEKNLINQLLSLCGLSLNWREVITPLVHEIVDKIQPDKTHDAEDLDIRHHVQFKKIPGGNRQECKLVEGIVCTKNVAHRGMSTELENPKILLLNCSLVYQRTEGRLMSLEPVILQEHEYLRNVAKRILILQPNLVLVHRNVSRLAQDLLRDNNITLVYNVKLSILERLAKCCKADVITAIDAHMGQSKLGVCKKFYLKTFTNNESMQKTLMFFEGLPYPHLGATVLLRGASKGELTKLKHTIQTVTFASYNWRLEKSFLMDEFAQPPNPKADEFFGDSSSKESSPDFHVNRDIKDRNIVNTAEQKVNENEPSEPKNNKTKNDIVSEKKIDNEEENIVANNRISSDEKRLKIDDYSDPLHQYLTNDVEIDDKNNSLQQFSVVAELPLCNKFRKALEETVLSISPYLQFFIPYLETDLGKKCKLREFFPNDIYYSKQFIPQSETNGLWSGKDNLLDYKAKLLSENIAPPHPFISACLTERITDSIEIQTLVANFRACGGRFSHKRLDCNQDQEKEKPLLKRRNTANLDILDVNNHQRIAVLFCSFSHMSNNAPAFCVDPWVVYMYFYGRDDIPLGCFLERYCFRSTYVCQSHTCDTPMFHHIRRFVHNSGCVSISLNSFDSKSKEDIVMWSWCCKCSAVSPVVPMSSDTWSFSFAKYLELRFYTGVYSRRGTEACQHSLHHDHHQYFGYKNLVAVFKYTSIKQWEISLPPPLIEIKYNTVQAQQTEIIDEIKSLAFRGHEVFSIILEKISALPNEGDAVTILKQQLQKEHAVLKGKVEEVQLKLTSPTLEDKKINDFSFEDVKTLIWPLEDLIVQLKRIIADTVETWNGRLVGSRKRDLSIRKDKQQSAHVLEDTDTSETEGIDTKNVETVSENIALSEGHTSTILQSKKIRSLDHTDFLDDNTQVSTAPKGHYRSQSDGTVMTQTEDTFDGKKDMSDKKSMKAIIAQLLASNQGITSIQYPFESQEHHLLPPTTTVSIVVYENELSSIIAYALDTFEYKKSLDELLKKMSLAEQAASPIHKRKTLTASDRTNSTDLLNSGNEKPTGLLSFLWANQKSDALGSGVLSGSDCSETEDPVPTKEKTEDAKKSKPPYIEVEFQDSTSMSHCNFCCRIYYAEKFMLLRKYVIPAGEEAYVRSLCRSVQWNARGGKSGSSFCKTKDDRFILKEMTKQELQQFLDSGTNYFAYMEKCISSKLPTLLGKIVGVYQIMFRNATTNANIRINLLVMENLFYNRTVSHKFDLKGSMRNRLVNPDDQDGEIVLLDENLLKRTCESPLYIYPHSKAVLTAAIQSDTEFLSSQRVMDYSLLVGLDEETKELVVGIIDYIRTFTWDKKLETMVKKAGILGGQGRLPTIISPEEYRERFIAAMHRYFLQVPDRWTGLGKGLDC